MSKNKFFATTATAALVAAAIVPAAASAAQVNDMDQVPSWAKEAVQYLIDNGTVQGDDNGNFNPTKNLTRAQAAEILMKEKDLPATGTENFSDVKEGIWYYNAVLATSPEIFNGDDNGKFNPNNNLTRQEAAKVIVEAFGLTGTADLSAFGDAAKVPAWAKSYFETAVANGVINGKGSLLAPTDNITNAEFATMIKRAVDAAEAPTVESVSAINDITINEGQEVVLPETVEVTLSNDEKAQKEVEWNVTGLDVNKPGEYVVKGDVADTDLEASVKVIVKAVDLEVTGVSAVNGSTIQVKFSKAVKPSTVIDSTNDTLVDGNFSYEVDATGSSSVNIDAKKAELSEDGKTLTIYNAAILEGNYVFNIAKDVVLTADGTKALPAVKEKFSIKDTTRAAVENVTNESKYVFNINLTEPVSSTGTVTATLADGTNVLASAASVINNGKTIQVTLDNTNNNVKAGKDVTITIPALTDYANNISVPLTQTVKVSNADVTAPKVVSAVATSTNTVEVTFDEAVTVDATKTLTNFNKFKFNGSAADTVISGIAPKAGDTTKTKFVVTLGANQTTAAYLDLLAGAATDLNGNDLEATSKLVTFNADKTAPTITSTSVQKIGGVNYLVVNFSEQVSLVGNSALSFKYVDEYGMEKTTTLAATNIDGTTSSDITANGTDGKSFKIALTNVSPALETGVEYTVEFAKGYFEDAFLNDIEKTSVKFVNNVSETTTTTKLVATIGTEGVDADGRYITVNFDKTVDPVSAVDKANYVVEGATVKEVKLASNTATSGSVKVYLEADTVELNGNYQVTVKNVKGFNSSITSINETTATVVITENLAAKVASKAITFGPSTVIDLTFNESVTVGANVDYDLYIDGVKSTASVATTQIGAGTAVTVTITGLDLSGDIASGKSVVLKANGSFDIVDANSNVASKLDIVLN